MNTFENIVGHCTRELVVEGGRWLWIEAQKDLGESKHQHPLHSFPKGLSAIPFCTPLLPHPPKTEQQRS